MTKEKDISVEYLRTRLRYEPETGKLFWLDNEDMPKKWRTKWAGKEAFTAIGSEGYKQGGILNKNFSAHRVVWALYYGKWPDKCIDHINGIKDDNKIENLRVVSNQENSMNLRKYSRNTSGVVGVYWDRCANKWKTSIGFRGNRTCLGYFACIGQAIKARREAEELYGFHPNHGKR